MKKFATIILIAASCNSTGQENLVGFYSSNTPDVGSLVTKIQLEKDMTFKYELSGDLFYDGATGKYRVEEPGTTVRLEYDSVELEANASSRRGNSRPDKLLYKEGNLYGFHVDTGEMTTKIYFVKRPDQELILRK